MLGEIDPYTQITDHREPDEIDVRVCARVSSYNARVCGHKIACIFIMRDGLLRAVQGDNGWEPVGEHFIM